MSDEVPPVIAAAPADSLESVSNRIAALEAAVASLGAIHVTQNHDSLARFREWLSSYLVRR
jgi:hypothetical protein